MFGSVIMGLVLWGLAGSDSGKTPVAEVKGQVIYLEDVQDAAILELRQELFKKLELAIAEKASAILENHPHDDDPDHLIEHFRGSVKSGEVKLMIDVPPPVTYQVPLGEGYVRSNEGAPLMMMAFIDSQCPYCAEVLPILERLERTYRKKLAVVLRHLPLESHPAARQSAIAMECAREQGKMDFLYNALIVHPEKQSLEDLALYAAQGNVPDLETFKACLTEGRYDGRLKDDEAAAQVLGLSSTPSIIIGSYDATTRTLTGEKTEGALTFAEYKEILDRYLAQITPAP